MGLILKIKSLPAKPAPPEPPSPATLSAILDPHDKPLIWTSDRHL